MLYRILTLFGCIMATVFLFIIISFIPIDFIKTKINQKAANHNMLLEMKNSWHLDLSSLQITNNNYSLNTILEQEKGQQIQIVNYGKNIGISLFHNEFFFKDSILDITVEEDVSLDDIINAIKNQIGKQNTSYQFENVIIQFFNKKSSTSVNKKAIKKIFFKNLTFNKKSNNTANIIITTFLNNNITLAIEASKDKNEEMLTIRSDNINFKYYSENNNGIFTCDIKNLQNLLLDFGYNNIITENILPHKIYIKGQIDNESSISATIKIDKNDGTLAYSKKNNNISIKFQKIDLTAIKSSEQDNNKTVTNIQDAITGFNPWIAEILQDHNSVLFDTKTLFIILMKQILNKPVNLKIKIDKIQTEKQILENIWLNFDVTLNQILMKELYGKFKNNIISIKENKDNKESSIISISGDNLDELLDLVGSKYHLKENFTEKYKITGEFISQENLTKIKNFNIELNKENICNINLTYQKNNKGLLETQEINHNIVIQNINLPKTINMEKIYKILYEKSEKFKHNKQIAIIETILKKLSQQNNKTIEQNLQFKNCKYNKELIENFTINAKTSDIENNISIESKSGNLDFKFKFEYYENNLSTIATKGSIEGNIINISIINTILKDYMNANNLQNLNLLTHQQNYSIPSFINTNGTFTFNIKEIFHQNDKILENFKGNIKISNGIFDIYDTQVTLEDGGTIAINSALTLQSIPKIELGIATSGLKIDNIFIQDLKGYLNSEWQMSTQGFSIADLIKNLKAGGKGEIVKLQIPKFDIYTVSKILIHNRDKTLLNINENNIKKYEQIITDNSLLFNKSEIMFKIENGNINSNISVAKQLISGVFNFEYDITNQTLNNSVGKFIMTAKNPVKKAVEKTLPIYIPIACNGKLNEIKCIISWKNLETYLE